MNRLIQSRKGYVGSLWLLFFFLLSASCASTTAVKSDFPSACIPNAEDVEAQRVLLAAKKFAKDHHGKFMAFDELVPEYLEKVPSQSNLQYDPETRTFFYSFIVSDLLGCEGRAKLGDSAYKYLCY